MRTRVAILLGNSLLTEGIISKLRLHHERFDLQILDRNCQDPVAEITATRPLVVILDDTDSEISPAILPKLLSALPALTLILVNPCKAQIQLIRSKWQTVGDVESLMTLVEPINELHQDQSPPADEEPAINWSEMTADGPSNLAT